MASVQILDSKSDNQTNFYIRSAISQSGPRRPLRRNSNWTWKSSSSWRKNWHFSIFETVFSRQQLKSQWHYEVCALFWQRNPSQCVSNQKHDTCFYKLVILQNVWPLRPLIRVMRRHDLRQLFDNFEKCWKILIILAILITFDNFEFFTMLTIVGNFLQLLTILNSFL